MGILRMRYNDAICVCDQCDCEFLAESFDDCNLCDDCARKNWEEEEARKLADAEAEYNEVNGIVTH
jgi:hypothetical protein